MITLRELRTISLEFRRVSSNFLNCDDDTADVALIRFYSYLTKTESLPLQNLISETASRSIVMIGLRHLFQ